MCSEVEFKSKTTHKLPFSSHVSIRNNTLRKNNEIKIKDSSQQSSRNDEEVKNIYQEYMVTVIVPR